VVKEEEVEVEEVAEAEIEVVAEEEEEVETEVAAEEDLEEEVETDNEPTSHLLDAFPTEFVSFKLHSQPIDLFITES